MSVAIDPRLIRRQPVPGFGFELVESPEDERSVLGICDFEALCTELSRSGLVICRGFQVSLQDLEILNSQVSGQKYRRIDECMVHSELTVSAITTGKFSGKRALSIDAT